MVATCTKRFAYFNQINQRTPMARNKTKKVRLLRYSDTVFQGPKHLNPRYNFNIKLRKVYIWLIWELCEVWTRLELKRACWKVPKNTIIFLLKSVVKKKIKKISIFFPRRKIFTSDFKKGSNLCMPSFLFRGLIVFLEKTTVIYADIFYSFDPVFSKTRVHRKNANILTQKYFVLF